MGDKMNPRELFDRTSTAAARIREVVAQAEDVFWEALAKSLPECRTGDFPPDAAAKFHKACEEAAATWFDANKPPRWEFDDRLDKFTSAVQEHAGGPLLGWEVDYEFPGYMVFSWAQGGWKYHVDATPDWDEEPGDSGFIAVSVETEDGAIDSAIIPWPFEGRTVESYCAALTPILTKYAPPRTATCAMRVEMRAPKVNEIGYYVRSRTAHDALAEVLEEVRTTGEVGWTCTEPPGEGPDDDGLVPCTIIFVPADRQEDL